MLTWYELYNTSTEQVEGSAWLTHAQAKERNEELRANDEPQRWITAIAWESGEN